MSVEAASEGSTETATNGDKHPAGAVFLRALHFLFNV